MLHKLGNETARQMAKMFTETIGSLSSRAHPATAHITYSKWGRCLLYYRGVEKINAARTASCFVYR